MVRAGRETRLQVVPLNPRKWLGLRTAGKSNLTITVLWAFLFFFSLFACHNGTNSARPVTRDRETESGSGPCVG